MNASQLLSNFKLFSQSEEESTTTNPSRTYLILGVFVIGVCCVLYSLQDEIASFLNSWVGNLWLSTHLTPEGELASTYVPDSFSLSSVFGNGN
jgi:hypothetical protein